jgi:hypothetical protein
MKLGRETDFRLGFGIFSKMYLGEISEMSLLPYAIPLGIKREWYMFQKLMKYRHTLLLITLQQKRFETLTIKKKSRCGVRDKVKE